MGTANMISYTQLTRNAAYLSKQYALYGLKHVPTGAVYFGSTLNLSQRLMNWLYAFGNPATPLPSKVARLCEVHGRNHLDWGFAIYDTTMPPGYKPRSPLQEKPEWAYVQWMRANAPILSLNDSTGKGGRPSTGRPQWGPMGVSPLKYLHVMLGVHRGTKWPSQPPCCRPVDTRSLTPVGSLANVPFAAVLMRAMDGGTPRHLNPTPAAIDELYQKWRAVQPARDVPYPGTITTAEQALALPDPGE